LNGDAIDELDEHGERVVGATLVLLINGGADAIPFVLPAAAALERWETLTDTADPWQLPRRLRGGERYHLQSRSVAVLRLEGHKDARSRDPEWGPMGVY
jgi:isoamylase